MKALASTLFVASLVSTQAHVMANELKLVCRELDGGVPTTLVLEIDPGQESKLSRGGLDEGVKYDYTAEIFVNDQSYRELEVKGTVETEDVMFVFDSNDGRVSFNLYLDELDQSTLRVDGKATRMVCF